METFKASPEGRKIVSLCGDMHDQMVEIEARGPYDLAFVDADKSGTRTTSVGTAEYCCGSLTLHTLSGRIDPPTTSVVVPLDMLKVNGRHIGVSNFNRQLLSRAISLSAVPLVTNQFEYHPYLNQSLLVDATREAGLSVTAYCAMIGRVLLDRTLAEIAEGHGRTIPEVVLRWRIQQGNIVALSRTTNPDRVVENLAVFDFGLGENEMVAVQTLARPKVGWTGSGLGPFLTVANTACG